MAIRRVSVQFSDLERPHQQQIASRGFVDFGATGLSAYRQHAPALSQNDCY